GYEVSIKKMLRGKKNLSFIHSKIEDYKTTQKFDLIVHLTVFEHMNNPKAGFDRIFALLEPDGVIFLTAPNKYWIFEQHYGLPFLGWLPLPLANLYLKLAKGVESYEDCSYSRGYGGMKSFFDRYDCEYEFIIPKDTSGAYVGCGNSQPLFSFIKWLGIRLIKMNPFFWNFSKGFIMIIRKK
ncbi:MAG: methyltransferase domain-containing protein, partial [Chitinophagaceae bacterium]